MNSVKRADRPDSVQRPHPLRDVGAVTAIPLGRESPTRLDATYPHTPRTGSTCAYSVLLRVEIARFTRGGPRVSASHLGWLFGSGLAPGPARLAPCGLPADAGAS